MSKKTSLRTLAVMAGLAAVAAFGCKGAKEEAPTPTAPEGDKTAVAAPATRPAPSVDGPAVSGDTIKVGLVASQNGDLRPWGVDCIDGVKLAEALFNESGGVNGKKVQVLVGDSNSDPANGKSAAEKLIADGVVALVGEVASGITIQMANVAFEKGVPVVAVGATRTDISNIGSNVFRVCYTDDFQGPVMAKFAFDRLGLKNVAIITDNKTPYSQGLSASFRATFEKLGGTIVDEQFYESGQTQFTAQLTELKSKNPEGIFMSGYFPEVGPMAKQIRALGMDKVKLFGGDGWDSMELTSLGGDAIVGGYYCNHYNNKEQRPEVADFLGKWKAKYKTEPPTAMGALGFDAAMLVFDALKRSNATNSKDLIAALEDTSNFKGVSGEITLKGFGGNPPKRALVVRVTKGGTEFEAAYSPDDLK